MRGLPPAVRVVAVGALERVLLEHGIEDEHVLLDGLQKVRLLPLEVPLRVGHVVVYQTQHVLIHSLPVRLHVLPDLAEHLLKSLLHLIRRVVVLLVNLLSVRGSSRQLVLLV